MHRVRQRSHSAALRASSPALVFPSPCATLLFLVVLEGSRVESSLEKVRADKGGVRVLDILRGELVLEEGVYGVARRSVDHVRLVSVEGLRCL